MPHVAKLVICLMLLTLFNSTFAETTTTKRIPQLSNHRVNVWQTIIYPTKLHTLTMHRHDYDRVVVALSSGTLKVTNDKGKIHYLKLEKGKSYYLTKDPANQLHSDENISPNRIKVVVIELK